MHCDRKPVVFRIIINMRFTENDHVHDTVCQHENKTLWAEYAKRDG